MISDKGASTLRSNVLRFHSYEFGCDRRRIYTQQQLPYHETKAGKENKKVGISLYTMNYIPIILFTYMFVCIIFVISYIKPFSMHQLHHQLSQQAEGAQLFQLQCPAIDTQTCIQFVHMSILKNKQYTRIQ